MPEASSVNQTMNTMVAVLGIIVLSSVLCLVGYVLWLSYVDGTAKLESEIDSLDTCYKLSLFIQDHSMSQSYFSGHAGDKFVHDCIEPIFHKKLVSSNDVLIYLRNASCDDVNKWILDKYPWSSSAEFEYKYRCLSDMKDGVEG